MKLCAGFEESSVLISRVPWDSLAFIITPKDGVVRWVGNPEDMAAPLDMALKAA